MSASAIRNNRIFDSRFSLAASVVLITLCCIIVGFGPSAHYVTGDRGMALPSANDWLRSDSLQAPVAFLLNLFIIGLMTFLNRRFNLLRSLSYIYALFFGILQLGTPFLTAQLYTGPVLCLTIIVCVILTLSCYADTGASQRVFLIFFLLSGMLCCQYAYLFYIPVFIIALAQMRIFSRRTLLAALLGLLTPWWILLGFGIIHLSDIHLPQFRSIFSDIDLSTTLYLLVAVGATVLISAVSYLGTFIKSLTYNAQTRAKNGVILMVTFFTLVAMAVDYINITAYVYILNACAAFLLSQFFIHYRLRKAWIWISIIFAFYLSLFLLNIYSS